MGVVKMKNLISRIEPHEKSLDESVKVKVGSSSQAFILRPPRCDHLSSFEKPSKTFKPERYEWMICGICFSLESEEYGNITSKSKFFLK